MKILFHSYGKDALARWLICARLGSAFSHSAVQFGTIIYESTMLKGVHEKPASAIGTPVHTTALEVSDADYKIALAKAKSLVGKKYDYRALLGFILFSNLQSDKGYFCSEYAKEIFIAATGFDIKLYTLTSPGELRIMIDSWIKGRNSK